MTGSREQGREPRQQVRLRRGTWSWTDADGTISGAGWWESTTVTWVQGDAGTPVSQRRRAPSLPRTAAVVVRGLAGPVAVVALAVAKRVITGALRGTPAGPSPLEQSGTRRLPASDRALPPAGS